MGLSFKSGHRSRRGHPPAAHRMAQRRHVGLGQFWLLAFVGALLISSAALAMLLWQAQAADRALRDAQLRAAASALAFELTERGRELRGRVAELSGDSRLRQVFEYADQANFSAEEEHIKQRWPGVLAVRLIRVSPGAAGPRIHPDDESRLSYAGVDLARQVIATREVSLLEAHRVKQDDEHLALAGPVLANDGTTIVGLVHLALPLALLPTPAPAFAAEAHFAFEQQVGRNAIVISPGRSPAAPADALVQRIEVPQTSISLAAWQPPPRLGDFVLKVPALLLAVVQMLALGALCASLAVVQRRQVTGDLGQLTAALALFQARQPLPKRDIRVAELAPLDAAIAQLGSIGERFAAAGGSVPEARDVSALVPELGAEPVAELDLDLPVGAGSDPVAPGLNQGESMLASRSAPPSETLGTIPARVFRAYDIRGLVGREINDEFMRLLGQAVGSESQELGSNAVLVGRDHRASSEGLAKALTAGLRESGCDVIDLGMVPTPVLYFATHLAGNVSGAMVTASHNPSQYNGVKLVFCGQSASALTIAKLRQRLQRGEVRGGGDGSYREQSVLADYFDELEQNVRLARSLKLVIDCGFAAPALVAPHLFRALGCEVVELGCDLTDERTGVRIPNPANPDSLGALAEQVRALGADLGLAFDGDGDRLGVLDSAGQFIATDRLLMLLATDVLTRLPGSPIVFDVKCSHHLANRIEQQGGKPVMWKSGHSFIKEKRAEIKAPLAGEFSGHIVFGDRWNGFDDAFYAAARLLEILSLDSRPSCELFAEYPVGLSTPEILVPVAAGQELEIMSMVMETKNRLSGVRINTTDGLRVETDKGWGLVRASNTEPALSFRFEAEDQAMLDKIKDLFRRVMKSSAPKLRLPF